MKGLNVTNQKYINCQCRTIAKLDNHGISDKELRNMIYKLGVYMYRVYHDAGLPADFMHPGLHSERKIWSKEQHAFVPESQLAIA